MGLAQEVADRVIFMHNGLIEEEGDPGKILSNPNSDRLRSFLRIVSKEAMTG